MAFCINTLHSVNALFKQVESISYKKNTCCAVNKRKPFTNVKSQTKELAGKKDSQTNTEGGEKLWDSDLQRI